MTDVQGSFSQEAKIPTETGAGSAAHWPVEIRDVLLILGEVEWGATAEKSAAEHGESTKRSVLITAAHFNQNEPQSMHGLYLTGTETVLCHTGTSPNSPNTARALAAAWNLMVAQARADAASLPVSPSRDEAEGGVNP